ncbi:MAG: ABC transporter ATP-binding protein [Chitinophagaceae bacterium]|nr:ABC transporter ATP-binding protein [Chitinophagaceae bacterium]
MPHLLQVHDLSVNFKTESGKVPALHNISFHVDKGEVLAIVGESGSGKSVTSLSILQLLPAPPAEYSSGEIIFSDDSKEPVNLLQLSSKQMQQIRGNKISMIFQEPMTSLNPVFTCGQQVMEAVQLHLSLPKEEAKNKTIHLFERVKLPDPQQIFNRYPHQLSGGQKQRVMIAMAICCNPSLLIADEPTTALDVTVQKTILELIKELQQEEGMGVIFITHDLGVVAEIADRIAVMFKGKIVEQGKAEQIFNAPQHPYAKALLACRPALYATGERLPVVSDFMVVDEDRGIKETARKYEVRSKMYEVQQTENGKQEIKDSLQKLIEVRNLNVWFPAKTSLTGKPKEYIKAVNNISFEVYEGETLGLVGESGCGKTTLGRTLLRLIEPTSGEIIFKEENLLKYSKTQLREIRKDVQIIFQDPYSSLNPRLTVGNAIVEPLAVHGLYQNNRQRKDKVTELLEKVNLEADHFNRYPHEFSGGQRQRICIARALALNPGFIICDEPVSALDVSVQAQVLNLLNDLKKEFGFTAIFISHDLSVVRYISNRIMVMNKGQVEEMGDADEIYHRPQKEYTRRLIQSIPKGMVS